MRIAQARRPGERIGRARLREEFKLVTAGRRAGSAALSSDHVLNVRVENNRDDKVALSNVTKWPSELKALCVLSKV